LVNELVSHWSRCGTALVSSPVTGDWTGLVADWPSIVRPMENIRSIVQEFAARLTAVIDGAAVERARTTILAAFGNDVTQPKRRGRPPKGMGAVALSGFAKPRKKAPVQLCPVPGCKNPAAPIFGMVCAKHKDLPKRAIKKYREARRLKKQKAAAKAA
jgi:hypothetical protein